MTDLNDANATVRTAYQNHIETLADGAREEIEADPDCDRDRLLHETADASRAVSHHPHLALAASENAPRPADYPNDDAIGLAYYAVRADLRDALSDVL